MLPDVDPADREDVFWSRVRDAGAGFWYDLEPLPWADLLLGSLRTLDVPVLILTSPAWISDSAAGKVRWMQRAWGRKFDDYVITRHKKYLARPGALLVDDSARNVQAFRDAGAKAVLFPATYNGPAAPLYLPENRIYPATIVERVHKHILKELTI
jgi:5'(3')-deoxyribonucleotidase